MKDFFTEVYEVFPDTYVHLGGDEVDFKCWYYYFNQYKLTPSIFFNHRASNPEILKFMKARGWGSDYARLEQFFMQRLINVTQNATKGEMRYLVWQEVIDNKVVLPTDTVIHVWKDGNNFHEELARVRNYSFEE